MDYSLVVLVSLIFQVLGTFITEWDEGKANCDVLLSTKESAQMYAERLTELAVQLGFDGWLVNILLSLYYILQHICQILVNYSKL
jgi:hypothetical protein